LANSYSDLFNLLPDDIKMMPLISFRVIFYRSSAGNACRARYCYRKSDRVCPSDASRVSKPMHMWHMVILFHTVFGVSLQVFWTNAVTIFIN